MVDVKWSSPTDLTVSGGATYTQADLDAHIGAALAEAAEYIRNHVYTTNGGDRSLEPVNPRLRGMDQHHATIASAILALNPSALTALDRAKLEARVEGMRAAAKPLTDAEAASICLTYRHDFGLLGPDERAALIRQAKEWHNAMRHHFRALIEKEGKP